MRLLAVLAMLCSQSVSGAESAQLGVLEVPQCAQDQGVRARVMFTKDDATWKAVNAGDRIQPPPATDRDWSIMASGKIVGTLRLNDPSPESPKLSDWFYPRDKLYVPVGNVPPAENSARKFAGWCEAPARRPLAIVSTSMAHAPPEWTPFAPSAEYRVKLYSALRLVLGRNGVFRCRDSNGEIAEPFEFRAADLQIHDGYRSRTKAVLVSIGLNPADYGCDGPSEAAWSPHWFLLTGKSIDFVGNQMELVVTGDFAGDGKSEALFWSSGYNKDGYILLFDNFRNRAEYLWNYH